MRNIFTQNRKEEAKRIILKELFNSREQKKAILKAARESANDQKTLVEKYKSLKLHQKC